MTNLYILHNPYRIAVALNSVILRTIPGWPPLWPDPEQVSWLGCRHPWNEILVSHSLNTCKIDEHWEWQTAWEHCRPFSWGELTSVHLSPFCSHPYPLDLTCVAITGLELLSPCVQSWTINKAEYMCQFERWSFNHADTTASFVGVEVIVKLEEMVPCSVFVHLSQLDNTECYFRV